MKKMLRSTITFAHLPYTKAKATKAYIAYSGQWAGKKSHMIMYGHLIISRGHVMWSHYLTQILDHIWSYVTLRYTMLSYMVAIYVAIRMLHSYLFRIAIEWEFTGIANLYRYLPALLVSFLLSIYPRSSRACGFIKLMTCTPWGWACHGLFTHTVLRCLSARKIVSHRPFLVSYPAS